MPAASSVGELHQIAEKCQAENNDQSTRVFGYNLLMDHRLNTARKEHLLQEAARLLEELGIAAWTPDDTLTALQLYHAEYVRSGHPAYLWKTHRGRAFNKSNFVPRSQWPENLATVVSLNSWFGKFRETSSRHAGLAAAGEAGLPHWGPKQRLRFARRALAEVWDLRDQRPTWVTDWEHFCRSVDFGAPSTWIADVGVRFSKEDWLVVLRYKSDRVKQLLRPTVLEAIPKCDYHFPSPPRLKKPERPGIPMALRDVPHALPLLPEWIHPPIETRPEDCVEVVHNGVPTPLCAQVGEEIDADAWKHRSRHRQRLEHHYPKEVPSWISEL